MNPPEDQIDLQPSESDDAIIGKAFAASLSVILLIGLFVGAFIWFLSRPVEQAVEKDVQLTLPEVRTQITEPIPLIPFTDITQSAGISFKHENGATGDKLLPETMGGGVAFLDYDSDGDQDLLFVNSCSWPDNELSDEPIAALYANNGTGNFEDVTKAAGLDIICYGMGIAIGDYDNDGDSDVFISAVGNNSLLRNDSGNFTDVSKEAGVEGSPESWSTSCGWLDYDNDGDLDLLVGNYVQWSAEIDLAQDFRLTGIGRAYGPPFSFQGTFPYLYRNEGNGKFTDVSNSSGIQVVNPSTGTPLAKTLGVALCDVNKDGWIDFVLANDTVQNLLFLNQQDGTFREDGIGAGIAFDRMGKARGAMGIDVECFRNDDCLGIAIGNFANEMSALYISSGEVVAFTDDAIPSGLGPQTRSDLSFGLFYFDADLDGRLDLFTANGHLENDINIVQKSLHYQQPPKLFWNAGQNGSSEFVPIFSPDSSALATPLVGRGAAYADIDADGDLDVVVTQIANRPALLRNDQNTGHHFLRIKLIGTICNRDAIGAWIEVRQGERVMRRQVMPTRSYLSQMELLVTVGLGSVPAFDKVTVYWPDGTEQLVQNAVVDEVTVVEQETER